MPAFEKCVYYWRGIHLCGVRALLKHSKLICFCLLKKCTQTSSFNSTKLFKQFTCLICLSTNILVCVFIAASMVISGNMNLLTGLLARIEQKVNTVEQYIRVAASDLNALREHMQRKCEMVQMKLDQILTAKQVLMKCRYHQLLLLQLCHRVFTTSNQYMMLVQF